MDRRRLGSAVLLLTCLKLWSINQDELVARDYPSDDPWYITSASNWYWGGSYGEAALIRQPAYPLWIAFVHATGIPLRVATELFLLVSAAVFVLALATVGLPWILSALLFAFIAFHPFSWHVNSYAWVDSFYAPVLLLALAAMLVFLHRPANRWVAILMGLALAVLWHTRQESALIVVYLLLLGGLSVWVQKPASGSLRTAARQVVPAILIPAAIVAASSVAARLANYKVYGIFTEYELAAGGYRDAYDALLQIVPGERSPGSPAPRDVRLKAYAVSPTFRLLRPYFEGPHGRYWKRFTDESDEEGDISTAMFPWALIDAARWSGHGGSAADADAFYRRMAGEIGTACDDGRLRCRPLPFGPFDPDVPSYITRLPSSAFELLASVVWSGELPGRRPAHPVRPEFLALFNEVTHRRTALVTDNVSIAGWAADLEDPVRAVSFRDLDGTVLAFTDQLRSRRDLEQYFLSKKGGETRSPTEAAFNLTIPFFADRRPLGHLVFTLQSGRTLALPYQRMSEMPLGQLSRLGDSQSGVMEYAIETREGLQDGALAQRRFQSMVSRVHGRVVLVLALLALGTLPLRAFGWRRAGDARLLDAAALLLIGVIGARLALLALIDASSWSATDVRFVYPVAYLVPCVALILIHGSVRAVIKRECAWPR